jgi:hypothetical protein
MMQFHDPSHYIHNTSSCFFLLGSLAWSSILLEHIEALCLMLEHLTWAIFFFFWILLMPFSSFFKEQSLTCDPPSCTWSKWWESSLVGVAPWWPWELSYSVLVRHYHTRMRHCCILEPP